MIKKKTFSRRDFITTAGVGLSVMLLSGCNVVMNKKKYINAKKPPNVILILADDLGYGELGCYGQEKIRTPHIDQMASEGMRFMQFYAGSPVCAPSRCCLLTGKHAGHAYVRNNHHQGNKHDFVGQLPLPNDELTLAEILKNRGYVTGCFGKWGLGNTGTSGDPLSKGFDRFYGYECQVHAHNLYPRCLDNNGEKEILEGNTRGITGEKYAPELIADEMLNFVHKNKDKRFFVYYPTVLPHLPLQVPDKYLNQYKGKWPETPYVGGGYLPNPNPKATYAAMVSFLDKQVGRLYSTLKKLKIDDDTIVIFTSDNGTTWLRNQVDYEFFNSVGPLRGLKGSLYEGGVRVPLIARWPGKIKQNTVTNHISANYDLLSTIGEITACKCTAKDGISFLPVLLNQKNRQEKHPYLFWDFAGYGGQIAVRLGKWKGIKRNLVKCPDSPLELYDLETDIGEKYDLVLQYPDIASEIENIMIEARNVPKCEHFHFGKYSE